MTRLTGGSIAGRWYASPPGSLLKLDCSAARAAAWEVSMQPVAMIARPSFSWKKGLLHGVAVIAIFMFLGMIFAATGAFGDQSEKIGEAVGRQMVIAFLLAVAASYGFQTEKKALGFGM